MPEQYPQRPAGPTGFQRTCLANRPPASVRTPRLSPPLTRGFSPPFIAATVSGVRRTSPCRFPTASAAEAVCARTPAVPSTLSSSTWSTPKGSSTRSLVTSSGIALSDSPTMSAISGKTSMRVAPGACTTSSSCPCAVAPSGSRSASPSDPRATRSPGSRAASPPGSRGDEVDPSLVPMSGTIAESACLR